MANRPGIIKIINKIRKDTHIDRCGNTNEQKCKAKEAEEKINCKCSCNQMQQMWITEFIITPVITGATVVETKV